MIRVVKLCGLALIFIAFVHGILAISSVHYQADTQRAREAGMRAEKLGMNGECNPYRESGLGRAWLDGFLDAREKRLKDAGIVR